MSRPVNYYLVKSRNQGNFVGNEAVLFSPLNLVENQEGRSKLMEPRLFDSPFELLREPGEAYTPGNLSPTGKGNRGQGFPIRLYGDIRLCIPFHALQIQLIIYLPDDLKIILAALEGNW